MFEVMLCQIVLSTLSARTWKEGRKGRSPFQARLSSLAILLILNILAKMACMLGTVPLIANRLLTELASHLVGSLIFTNSGNNITMNLKSTKKSQVQYFHFILFYAIYLKLTNSYPLLQA